MASTPGKRACVKCVKGVGIVTCDGCQQSFCDRHLPEHRQELSEQMDSISQDYSTFHEDLERANDPHPVLSRIDAWERESIRKIQTAAQKARVHLQELLERAKNELNTSFSSITTELHSSRKSNDYTEIDLKKWTEELRELQKTVKISSSISVVDDEEPSSLIRFIKLRYESDAYNLNRTPVQPKKKTSVSKPSIALVAERFQTIVGRATLSEKGLVATCSGYSSMSGVNLYSSGTHQIRFQILAKKNDGIFFGILTSLQDMTARATELSSVYGWRDFNRAIVNGNAQLKIFKEKNIQADDDVTLTIDCDNKEISLKHHRLNRQVQLSIDLKRCPLPWRMLVSSFGEDCVCILH